jgi:hypothetical protein
VSDSPETPSLNATEALAAMFNDLSLLRPPVPERTSKPKELQVEAGSGQVAQYLQGIRQRLGRKLPTEES